MACSLSGQWAGRWCVSCELLVLLVLGSRAGQGQRERRALSLLGPDAYVATVGGRDVLDDREPETRSTRGTVPGRVDAVEPLEDPVQLVMGDADALVDDRDLDHVVD